MTDSLGSKSSEHSGVFSSITSVAAANVAISKAANKMDVACVQDLQHTDGLIQRRKAYEEVKSACLSLGANFHHIQVWRVLNS